MTSDGTRMQLPNHQPFISAIYQKSGISGPQICLSLVLTRSCSEDHGLNQSWTLDYGLQLLANTSPDQSDHSQYLLHLASYLPSMEPSPWNTVKNRLTATCHRSVVGSETNISPGNIYLSPFAPTIRLIKPVTPN